MAVSQDFGEPPKRKRGRPRKVASGGKARPARRSDRIIEFISNLRVPSGFGQGEPFALRPWQIDFIRNVYDPSNEDGTRRIRRALLSVGRKNGKTALAAALVLVHLIGPEAKQNGEVYSAASDRDQAAIIYKCVKQMVELDPELMDYCKCIDSVKRIVCYHNSSFYRALSADARRQHGANPQFVIYDELAQALDRELYDVLNTSFGAQKEGLMLVISTQSSDPQSIMTELSDDALKCEEGTLDDAHFYGKVYTVPEGADPYAEDNWYLANPALGDFRDLTDFRALAAKARRSPSAEAAFRNLYLNQRVDGVQALVNSRDWRACEGVIPDEHLAKCECYGGLDLSGRMDLTAFTLCWHLPDGGIFEKTWFWTHENELDDREKKDGARYLEWQKAGFLTVLPGKSIDFRAVARQIGRIVAPYNLKGIAFDRFRIDELKRAFDDEGIDHEKLNLVEYGQGFRDMNPAIEAIEQNVIEHRLIQDGNPVLTYCLGNVRVMRDPAGNRKFDKRQPNRRIDGAVTLGMALALRSKIEPAESAGPSVYLSRGLRVL